MRRRSVLLVALASLGCAGPQQPAPVVSPAVAGSATRIVRPPPSVSVPLEARAVYSRADKEMLGLVEVGGRTLLVSPELVAPVRVEKSGDGHVLHVARPAQPLEQHQPAMPEVVELIAPKAGGPGWQLDGVEGRFAQLADPWATRLSTSLEQLELEHVDLRGFDALAQIRRFLYLLRDQPAAELQAIVSTLDPEWIKSKGGVSAYLAEQLWMEIEELRPAAAKNELAKLEHYLVTAKGVAYQGGTLWPSSDDVFLAKLAERFSHTDAKLVIKDGALMRIDTKDRRGVPGCDLGIMLPDPTEHDGRPWAPFTPPVAGKLGAFSYVMFVVQSGLPGTCEQLRPSEFAYPVRHGIYFFRLFADAQARVRGALFIGYMGAELYVTNGASEAEIMSMLRTTSDEISHQAE